MTTIGPSTNGAECPICLDLLSLEPSNPAVRPITETNATTKKFYSCISECSENCQKTTHKCMQHVYHQQCLTDVNNLFIKQQGSSKDPEPLNCNFCKIRITKEFTILTPQELADFENSEAEKTKESEKAAEIGKAAEEIGIKQEKTENDSEVERKKSIKTKKILIAKIAAIAFSILAIIAGGIVLAIMFL
jgi:hypothetical protein